MLSFPQFPYGLLIGCIHRQVESTDALNRRNAAISQCFGTSRNGLIRIRFEGLSLIISQPNLWAASRTRHRLSMKTPIQYLRILATAMLTHLKVTHCRIRPVIGNGLDNRISGSAVGTVDKRITMTKVLCIGHLFQASRTSCAVRHHLRDWLTGIITFDNVKYRFFFNNCNLIAAAISNLHQCRVVRRCGVG